MNTDGYAFIDKYTNTPFIVFDGNKCFCTLKDGRSRTPGGEPWHVGYTLESMIEHENGKVL